MTEKKKEPWTEDLGGDGLHRRTVTHYPDPDAEDFRRVLDFSTPEYFWGIVAEHLTECDAILKDSGYDPGVYPGDRTADPFSEDWYAGQIGWRCKMLIGARADGDDLPAVLLLYIMQIGALAKDRHWRMSYRYDLLKRVDTLKAARTGGEMRRDKLAPKTSSVLCEMTRLVRAGTSVSGAAQAVARRGIGASVGANRALWYRHKKL